MAAENHGMIGWIVRRARCLRGQHHRSAHRVHRRAGSEQYESVCRYCETPLVRLAKRRWVVKPPEA